MELLLLTCRPPFACLTIHTSQYRQAAGGKKYKHAKKKTKRKATRGRSDTSRAAAAFKAGRTRAFLSSPHYAGRADRRGVGGGGWGFIVGSGGVLRPAGELQIHLHLSALGGCPQKLLASVLTLMGANERRRHVFPSSSFFPLYQRLLRLGGSIDSSHSSAVLPPEEQMLRSLQL